MGGDDRFGCCTDSGRPARKAFRDRLLVLIASAQAYLADPRNAGVKVWVNGALVAREKASVSVFDAGFVLGDGIWEGLRLVEGRIVALDDHLDRLFEGANAIRLDIGLDRKQLVTAVDETLAANAMTDGVHIRLMVTRGVKTTPNQDPRFAPGPATVAIVAEHKRVDPQAKARGLVLATATIRCSGPDVFDLRLNSHSRLNFIQALIQAIDLGADEALMLDPSGFVASCNSTNFFIVRRGELWTSTGRFNFKGITRGKVIGLARQDGITVRECDFTLGEAYAAEEAFVTGTLAGVTPVRAIDGRESRKPLPGPLTFRLSTLYEAAIRS